MPSHPSTHLTTAAAIYCMSHEGFAPSLVHSAADALPLLMRRGLLCRGMHDQNIHPRDSPKACPSTSLVTTPSAHAM